MTTSKLTSEKIAELASGKNVKTSAVQNFLFSLGDMRESDARGNLEMDAASYKWNVATVKAIGKGLNIHYSDK